MKVAGTGLRFHNYTNKLFKDKPISRFGAAFFVVIFVVLISFAGLFDFFQA